MEMERTRNNQDEENKDGGHGLPDNDIIKLQALRKHDVGTKLHK